MVSPIPSSNSERRLTALARILKLLRETDELDRLISALLENLKEELQCALLWFGEYDRVQHQLLGRGFLAATEHRLLKNPFVLSPGDLMEQVVIQQRPLIVNDLRVEARIGFWNSLATDLEIQGTLIFPVRRRDVCYGVLVVGDHTWGQPIKGSDRTFLSAICSALADVLHKQEQATQHQTLQDPAIAVSELIEQLQGIGDREKQIAITIQALGSFIQSDRVRLFWLNQTCMDFWERFVLQPKKSRTAKRFPEEKAPNRFNATEMRGAYQMLANRQLVVLGDSQAALIAMVPEKFMQTLGVEALMAAPIFENETLLGFITIENQESRIWTEHHRSYLKAVTQLLSLMMPRLSIEEIKEQLQSELHLLTGVVHSIQDETDWYKTLDYCGEQIINHLGVQQVWILSLDTERGGYQTLFRKMKGTRKKISLNWQSLDELDWQLLEKSESAIAINDVNTDLKLLAWRENLLELEAQSFMVCNVELGNAPKTVMLVTHQTPRYWLEREIELLQKVAQQVGLVLRQWQLQLQTEQQGNLYDSLQWGMKTLQRTFQLDALEESACNYLVNLLDASLVVLVSWSAEEPFGQVSQVVSRSKDFSADSSAEIWLGEDTLVNWALQTDGPLPIAWEDFVDTSHAWLTAPPGSKFLLMALRTADNHLPSGMWVVADRDDRKWNNHELTLISLLANQLAWSRRHLNVVDLLVSRQESLETLNWYKHKRLDEIHRQLEQVLSQLSDPITQGKGITAQRQLQLIRQVDMLNSGIQQVLTEEVWHLQSYHQTTPLISLLNRLMDRAAPLIQARQLWAKVHNDSNVILAGDLNKIEFVLYEILTDACSRSPDQGRLDIWCRSVDRNWLEISITDDGQVSDDLIRALNNGRPDDLLVPSPLDVPPGLHMNICQALMQQVGGELSLQKLEDGRTLSRLLLAVSSKGKRSPLPEIETDDTTQ